MTLKHCREKKASRKRHEEHPFLKGGRKKRKTSPQRVKKVDMACGVVHSTYRGMG